MPDLIAIFKLLVHDCASHFTFTAIYLQTPLVKYADNAKVQRIIIDIPLHFHVPLLIWWFGGV